jgi:hypothetical protein
MIIKDVNIGGIARPVSYGFNALARFQEISGLALTEINSLNSGNMTLKSMIQFAWVGLWDGARKAKKDFPYSIEDVGDWLDEDSDAFIQLFGEFVQSQAPQDGKKSSGVAEGKKKVTM